MRKGLAPQWTMDQFLMRNVPTCFDLKIGK
jgi:hypothetical protein